MIFWLERMFRIMIHKQVSRIIAQQEQTSISLQKRNDFEGLVTKRSTVREIGCFDEMNPCADSISNKNITIRKTGIEETNQQNRKYESLGSGIADGPRSEILKSLILQSFPDKYVSYRQAFQKLKVCNFVRIICKYPWIPLSTPGNPHPAESRYLPDHESFKTILRKPHIFIHRV